MITASPHWAADPACIPFQRRPRPCPVIPDIPRAFRHFGADWRTGKAEVCKNVAVAWLPIDMVIIERIEVTVYIIDKKARTRNAIRPCRTWKVRTCSRFIAIVPW
ncbi:hypothetical protein D3C84_820890 [compost metagenome]